MTKKIAILTIILGIMIIGIEQYRMLLSLFNDLYTIIKEWCGIIFNDSNIGNFLTEFFTIILVCVIFTAIPALGYRLIFKRNMPKIIELFAINILLTFSAIISQ